MKEFDLEKAKAGKPVVTGEGYPVRIVCYDRHSAREGYPILALINLGDYEICRCFSLDGLGGENKERLMMKTEKVTFWANVYNISDMCYVGQTLLYSSKEEALENVISKKDYTYIDTVKIEVEV